jgi:hypothetical protein
MPCFNTELKSQREENSFLIGFFALNRNYFFMPNIHKLHNKNIYYRFVQPK